MTSPRLFALDASTTNTGWAVFTLGGEFASSGSYQLAGKAWDRIAEYSKWLDEMLSCPGIAVVAYEIASGNHGNMRTNRLLGALEGLTRVAAQQWEQEFVPVRTVQLRSTGAHKHGLAFAGLVRGRPFEWKTLAGKARCGDEADAIGVGLAALRILARREAAI